MLVYVGEIWGFVLVVIWDVFGRVFEHGFGQMLVYVGDFWWSGLVVIWDVFDVFSSMVLDRCLYALVIFGGPVWWSFGTFLTCFRAWFSSSVRM